MIKQKTSETEISLNLEGVSTHINTGIPMFDHLLSQMAKHGKFNLEITTKGDNEHHIVEDVGICLGQELLGMKKGRIGYAIVPMDDALAMVVIDFSGRGYPYIRMPNGDETRMAFNFLGTLAREGRFNLHIAVLRGDNSHHIAEAIFKALGRALRAGIEDKYLEPVNPVGCGGDS